VGAIWNGYPWTEQSR